MKTIVKLKEELDVALKNYTLAATPLETLKNRRVIYHNALANYNNTINYHNSQRNK